MTWLVNIENRGGWNTIFMQALGERYKMVFSQQDIYLEPPPNLESLCDIQHLAKLMIFHKWENFVSISIL